MYANLKKKYGQNFLIDENILNKISELIKYKNLEILEIGPGNGKLTDKILKKNPKHLTIIEIDKDLISELQNKYRELDYVEIINADILKYVIESKYQTVISNLPYNISSQVLVRLSLLKKIPDQLILMFQKEFAMRLLNKKINSINSLINCFYEIKLKFHVSKKCFRPVPKVDSSVLTFTKKKQTLLNPNEINAFIEFKRTLFSHKRKSLKNLLKKYYLKEKFDLDLRVEDLDLNTLIMIFRDINS